MTTEQPQRMSPVVALADALWLISSPGRSEDPEELRRIAESLGAAIDDVNGLTASRIGADEFLAAFDGGDFDNYSFYRGVQFALAKVHRTLRGEGDSR